MPVHEGDFFPKILGLFFPEVEAAHEGVAQHVIVIGREAGKEKCIFVARKLSKSKITIFEKIKNFEKAM